MLSNVDLWNKLRSAYPSFASHTAKGTADLFTERGWESINMSDRQAVDEFFNLSVRTMLIEVNISHAKDNLEDKDFGVYYDAPYGEIVQKMATGNVLPVSPVYRKYKNGDSIDPFKVRLPEVKDRAFRQNFDYQSWITIPDEFTRKTIFLGEFGMSEFMAGIMEGLQNGYKIQKYENKLEAINQALNSTKYPLKDTQKYQIEKAGGQFTKDELIQFILAIKNTVSAMDLAPQTDAYNALSFPSIQDRSRLRLLIRPGILNEIDALLMANTYHDERLNLPITPIEVPNFGGIEHYSDEGLTSKLYVHYDENGAVDGYSETDGGELYTGTVYDKDPNEDIVAMIADKALLFECRQNPYTVEPIRNPRGMYTNYFCNCPGGTVAVDPLYNMVVFTKGSEASLAKTNTFTEEEEEESINTVTTTSTKAKAKKA